MTIKAEMFELGEEAIVVFEPDSESPISSLVFKPATPQIESISIEDPNADNN